MQSPFKNPLSSHNKKEEILIAMRKAMPRDDLRGSFAGKENKGIASKKSAGKKSKKHSTKVKNRSKVKEA